MGETGGRVGDGERERLRLSVETVRAGMVITKEVWAVRADQRRRV